MTVKNTQFSDFPMFSKMDKAYIYNDAALKPFFKYDVNIDAFEKIILDKKLDKTDRKTLVEVLESQYAHFQHFDAVSTNISSLKNENTYTVTTAHQPSVFTGPLYFIYKIFSTIRLAENLSAHYLEFNFVPVFVIGGEDHDFEEVSLIQLFGKKMTWQIPENQRGSVGAMQTDSLKEMLEAVKAVMGSSENAKGLFSIFEKNYTENKIYHTATQSLLNDLFGKYGLVVMQMNEPQFKHLFKDVMKREVIEQPSKKFVTEAQEKLESVGFKAQAFAREINLFYMRENFRERIVESNGSYAALNTDYVWHTQSELITEIDTHPENFSPNVVLRPLYQERILPNLAYIGGGGEIAYWLERKKQFEYFGINFPMLIRRNSVMIVENSVKDKLAKLNFPLMKLTQPTESLVKQFINDNASETLNLESAKEALADIFDDILNKAISIDATLEKTVLAEKTRQLQSLESIETRIIKAEKQKHETSLNQLKALQQKLFPNGGLQERTDNFIPYYIKFGNELFDVLYKNLDPLKQGVVVLEE